MTTSDFFPPSKYGHFCAFFPEKSSCTILRPVVVGAGEVFSRVGVLPGILRISLHDLFGATGDGFMP
jgi:hypothetical protein